jgi:hypothetical protein
LLLVAAILSGTLADAREMAEFEIGFVNMAVKKAEYLCPHSGAVDSSIDWRRICFIDFSRV